MPASTRQAKGKTAVNAPAKTTKRYFTRSSSQKDDVEKQDPQLTDEIEEFSDSNGGEAAPAKHSDVDNEAAIWAGDFHLFASQPAETVNLVRSQREASQVMPPRILMMARAHRSLTNKVFNRALAKLKDRAFRGKHPYIYLQELANKKSRSSDPKSAAHRRRHRREVLQV